MRRLLVSLMAGIVLVVAGCGGGAPAASSSASPTLSPQAQAAAYLNALRHLAARDWAAYGVVSKAWSWNVSAFPALTVLERQYYQTTESEITEAKGLTPPASFADANAKLLTSIEISDSEQRAILSALQSGSVSAVNQAATDYNQRSFAANAAYIAALAKAVQKVGLQVPQIILTDSPTSQSTAQATSSSSPSAAAPAPTTSSSSAVGGQSTTSPVGYWKGQSMLYDWTMLVVKDGTAAVTRRGNGEYATYFCTWKLSTSSQITVTPKAFEVAKDPSLTGMVCDINGNVMTVQGSDGTFSMTRGT